jgi:alpha-ribazole phosphatase
MNKWQIVAYFCRHGETAANAEGRFRGAQYDGVLDEKGLKQAQKAAVHLRFVDFSTAFVSPKQRAEKTASIILQPHDKNATAFEELRALDVGFLTGEKKSDHKSDIEYFQRHMDEVIPGGESINQFRARVKPIILKAIEWGVKTGFPSLTVAHSSIIHEVNNIIHGDHMLNLVKPGGIIVVEFNGQKFRTRVELSPESSEDSKSQLG